MNEDMERNILIAEVHAYLERLRNLGIGVKDSSPKQDGTLDHLSTADMRSFRSELRDTVRSLGGSQR